MSKSATELVAKMVAQLVKKLVKITIAEERTAIADAMAAQAYGRPLLNMQCFPNNWQVIASFGNEEDAPDDVEIRPGLKGD